MGLADLGPAQAQGIDTPTVAANKSSGMLVGSKPSQHQADYGSQAGPLKAWSGLTHEQFNKYSLVKEGKLRQMLMLVKKIIQKLNSTVMLLWIKMQTNWV